MSQDQYEVATDPGSSLSDLLKAARYYPRLVAQNPALSLEFVVDPGAIDRLDVSSLAMLVSVAEAPRPLIDLAARMVADASEKHFGLAQALLANRSLEEQHVKHAVWTLAEARDLNETSVYHRQRYEGQPLGSPVEHVSRVLSRSPLEWLEYEFRECDLVNSLVPRVYLRNRVGGLADSARWAAEARVTAPEVLAYLGQNQEFSMLRERLAAHPHAPGSMLAGFVGDPWAPQGAVLMHPNLPAEDRRRILAEGDPDRTRFLALNPKLSCEEQLELIRRRDVAALPGLVENPNLCPEAARYIAALHSEDLGLLLTQRNDLTDETVEELMQHPHDSVKYEVTRRWSKAVDRVWRKKRVPGRSRRRGRTRKELEEGQEPAAQDQANRGPERGDAQGDGVKIPQPVLGLALVKQLIVATSRNLEPATLDTLANSYNAVVRLAVAAHPNSADHTRAWLADDADVRVAKAAREAPSLPV